MEFNGELVRYVLCHADGLSPEGRFLLLCLVHECSVENREIDISVERLVSKYGVTRTVCSEVSKYLSSPIYKLAQVRRSKKRFCEFDGVSLSKFSSDFDDGKGYSRHSRTVVDLLMKKSKGNECDLTTSNLLLLIILLIHSDCSGVVEGISKAKIRKMMGNISIDRLNSQLNKLTEKGHILVSGAGGSGRKLFGKVPKRYLLNIGHLKGMKLQADIGLEVHTQSALFTLENAVRKIQKIRLFNGYPIQGKIMRNPY